MTVDTRLHTAEDLLSLPDDGCRYELVQGELRRMSPSGSDHGIVAGRVFFSLKNHVSQHDVGEVHAAETGFLIARNPDTVRAPDSAFVTKERFVRTSGYFPGPPDLAVEVVSPNDRYSEVEEKTREWLNAGVRAVLIVDPRLRTVRVHRPAGATNVEDTLVVDDVVPGWRLRLSELFD